MARTAAKPDHTSSFAPYWERLRNPTEYTFNEGANAVRIYDDREGDTEQIHVQIHKIRTKRNGDESRRVATISCGGLDALRELVGDLSDALGDLDS